MSSCVTLCIAACGLIATLTLTMAQLTPPLLPMTPAPEQDVITPRMPPLTFAPSVTPALLTVGVTYPPLNPYRYHGNILPSLIPPQVTLPDHYTSPSPITNRSANSGTYLLTVPDRALPGFTFSLGVESFLDQPCQLRATIIQRLYLPDSNLHVDADVVSTSGTFLRGYPGQLHLPIPDNLHSGASYLWQVSCLYTTASHGCPFVQSNGDVYNVTYTLNYVTDVTTIFVQTDKAIYKPGQLVHYRVFAVYPDLSMYQGRFTIHIKDPNNNLIQWRAGVEGVQGVVEGELPLADQPVMGDWVIQVHIQTSARTQSYSKSFTVQQYQLPRFEVKVELPPYILVSDTALHGTVKATYTFGQPVAGMVELHVMSAYATQGACGTEPRHVELSFDINGEAKFEVPRTDIYRVASIYSGSAVKVVAHVKEALTDVTLEGSSTVTFRSTPYKVRVLDTTPSVFKPGLPFTVFAVGSQADDSPVTEEGGPHTLTLQVDAHYVQPADHSFLYGVQEFTGTYPLTTQHLPLPPSGVVKVDLDIPANATRLDIRVLFHEVTATKQVQQMYSASNNFLQLSLLDSNVQSGKTVRVQATATEPMTQLRYQILSRGVVCDFNLIDAQGQPTVTFDLPVTAKMAPTAHMMAYYIRPDLELVPDSMAFSVEGLFDNKVRVEFSSNRTEPHTALQVRVTADPGSLVSLLAVDQSVLLLKSGNDVTPQQVSEATARYDAGVTPDDPAFPLSLSSTSARSTLEAVGIRTFTDGDLSAVSRPRPHTTPKDPAIYGPVVLNTLAHYTTPMPGMTFAPGILPGQTLPPMTMFPTTGGIRPEVPGGGTGGGAGTGQAGGLKEVERVRNLFPDTWLWTNSTLGANGTWTLQTTVPDTITSWLTTAFATNLHSGLGISPSASKLTVFRSFFVSLTVPASAVRGEHVVVQATVFNYLPSDVTVLVSLPGSSQYSSIGLTQDGSLAFLSGDQQQTVTVRSGEQTAVYFPLIPTAVGMLQLEVSARSTLAADAVRRQLRVKAEGVPSELSLPVFFNLNPTGADVITHKYSITLPPDVIDGSLRTHVKVTGDLLGPSVWGLEELLRVPTGCGEQNMIRLAPDLYIANYLTATGQLTPAMKDRLHFLIQTGYQRELTYQRTDGSFSAFGNRDGTGSTWLTAFVLRVFHEARPYVYVDSGVLLRGLDWLTQRQNVDGSFNEFGHILDLQMAHFQDHSTGLTAFVLMALLQNSDVPTSPDQTSALQSAIRNATLFLEQHHHTIPPDDFLSLALTCLALTRAGSPVADTVFTALRVKATTENGMTYWKTPSNISNFDPWKNWRPAHVQARPLDIQVTSYALLVYSARGLLQEGMGVLHWLTRQRNPYGGFSSTQDTMVGLQAMTEYVQKAVPQGYDLHLEFRAPHVQADFNVTNSNGLVLQTKDFHIAPSEVTFTARGRGVAVAELDVFFNVETEPVQPAFEVSTVLLDDYLNSFKLMICTRWLLPGESGMVVQEVGIPSGFAPDMSSVGDVAGIKRAEQRGDFLDVYFDKMTKNSVCYTVMFDRQAKVAHNQPSYVITQDYYQPSNRAVVSYQSLSLKNSQVCDVCPACCGQA